MLARHATFALSQRGLCILKELRLSQSSYRCTLFMQCPRQNRWLDRNEVAFQLLTVHPVDASTLY